MNATQFEIEFSSKELKEIHDKHKKDWIKLHYHVVFKDNYIALHKRIGFDFLKQPEFFIYYENNDIEILYNVYENLISNIKEDFKNDKEQKKALKEKDKPRSDRLKNAKKRLLEYIEFNN